MPPPTSTDVHRAGIVAPDGLLIAGRIVPVPGLTVIPPASHGGPDWCALDPGDYRMRQARCRQVVLHTTKGDEPQHVKPGKGAAGAARNVAEFWHRDPTHSAAQLVIDRDGTVLCLADLAEHEAYHATVSNAYSVGIEMYQELDDGIYEAVFDAARLLVPALCVALDIPFNVVADQYNGHPLPRFLDGAPDFYGVCGHRNNTEQRGRGDPGDEIFRRLIAAGGEPTIAQQGQDLMRAKARQRYLNAHGAALTVDGLAGPASLAAARTQGFLRWSNVPT